MTSAFIHYNSVFASPIGKLGIVVHDEALAALRFLPEEREIMDDPVTAQIREQLTMYFRNPHHRFHLPTNAAGTAFQQRVWEALCEIPPGTTLTYGELARKLVSSPRAVGQACRNNPIPIIVPCHRVTSATGLGGFMGDTQGTSISIKQWLLQHERNR
jgi:methylated-DNA-[protein]-cysteine S-methyltransferase